MSTIRAVVVDPNAPGRLTLHDVDAPSPLPREALVRVAAVSLNRGEVRKSASAEAGWRPGWDVVGRIEQAAVDGSGPQAGARVVGLVSSGAWGELVALPTNALAELPDEVSFAQAATLPVAGLTALYALGYGGSLLERTVLITGASGGVGHFACQLARLSGAKVVGAFRNPEHEAFVRDAGAQEVVIGEDLSPAKAYGPYSLILDSVGGSSLATALSLLTPNGTCVFFGTSGGKEVTFDAAQFYQTGGTRLYGFFLFHELQRESASVGLKRLANLIAQSHLRPHIDVEVPWTQVGDIAQQLLDRRFDGKAVLHVSN